MSKKRKRKERRLRIQEAHKTARTIIRTIASIVIAALWDVLRSI